MFYLFIQYIYRDSMQLRYYYYSTYCVYVLLSACVLLLYILHLVLYILHTAYSTGNCVGFCVVGSVELCMYSTYIVLYILYSTVFRTVVHSTHSTKAS